MSDLQTLTDLVVKFNEERSWQRFHGTKDLILGLLVELGELAEHFQYLTGEELEQYQKDFKQEIGEEMADVLFWLLLMTSEQGIDLENAFKDKMSKNERKYPISDIDKKSGFSKTGKLYTRWRNKYDTAQSKKKGQ